MDDSMPQMEENKNDRSHMANKMPIAKVPQPQQKILQHMKLNEGGIKSSITQSFLSMEAARS